MKIICPKSGMVWEAEGFSTGHRRLVIQHPIFSMDLRGLVVRERDWEAGRLSGQEKVLLFLGVLNHSDMVKNWIHPAMPEVKVVESHFLHLLKLTLWKEGILSPNLDLPQFSINRDTFKLDNFHYWLSAWESGKAEFEGGILKRNRNNTKLKLETYLEARIRAVEMGIADEGMKYLKILAEWASIAGDFPTFKISHPHSKEEIGLDEYWKEIICTPFSQLYKCPTSDIKEIEDHLIDKDNLEDLSSLYAGALIRRLRKLIAGNTSDLGLELIELPDDEKYPGQRRYQEIIGKHEGTDSALLDIASRAPDVEPKPENYPTRAKFLQAMIAWKLAKKG